jgi:1-deoxy-D-xylulose-5-phosphate reductoisomerase
MNKGLEVIEAHWLFGLPPEKIDVVIHPQSVIHSMVEFVDGSIKAQLGVPDMKIPIQYALTYPDRSASVYDRVNFERLREITFFKPDRDKFRCLDLAYDALSRGGTCPAIMNAANEMAVQAFLDHRITFEKIPLTIQSAMDHVAVNLHPSLEEIFEADSITRHFVATHL